MRVLLLNPPSPVGMVANREGFGGLGVLTPGSSGFVYPSLRLAEAAGAAAVAGLQVRVADAVLAKGRAFLAQRAPVDAVVAQVSRATLASDLRHLQRFAAKPVVVTGVALAAVRGEILQALPLARLHEAAFGASAIDLLLEESPRSDEEAAELDPRWEAIPLGRSRRVGVVLARGCTAACRYCPYVTATGRRAVLRPVDQVLAHIGHLVRTKRPRRLVFRDPNFGVVRDAALALLDGLRRTPARQRRPFEIETRPELLDAEMVAALAEAGVVEVKLGIETLDSRPLIASRRVPDEEAAEAYRAATDRALRDLHKRGILVRGFYLDGWPEPGPALSTPADPRVGAEVRKTLMQPGDLGGGAA